MTDVQRLCELTAADELVWREHIKPGADCGMAMSPDKVWFRAELGDSHLRLDLPIRDVPAKLSILDGADWLVAEQGDVLTHLVLLIDGRTESPGVHRGRELLAEALKSAAEENES